MRKLVALVFLCTGCLEPYSPPASSGDINALVVDGFIDADGSASVTLSRSIPLDRNRKVGKESGAIVTIESSRGEIFSLHEGDSATYTANGLPVDKTSTYTLHIVTPDNNDYRSDAMQVYPTPPIDSVYYTISPGQVLEIRADSHTNDVNTPGYYLFYGIETFEYHAPIFAHYKLVNQRAVERLPEEEVFVCYRDIRTPNIIATTEGLRENRLSGVALSRIERTSEKISVRYSILVKQRAISEEEYTFQRLLITSTEQQGSLFAPMPGTVTSNIHSTKNHDEYVLGYFRAQEVKEFRYFIDAYQNPLPRSFYQRPPTTCVVETTCYLPGVGPPTLGDCVDPSALGESVGIVAIVANEARIPLRYLFATPECSNCTVQGGTTTRPWFWP